MAVSGVILAGGNSTRMGSDKALLDLAGTVMIARVAGRLRAVAEEIIVVADDAGRYAAYGDRCVPDVFPGAGALGGIHAGLRTARHDLAVVVGCDMPFLKPEVLTWLVDASEGVDLVVIRHELGREPLHAVYRRTCLPAIEASIVSGVRQVFAFYDAVQVRYVALSEIAALESFPPSYTNINTPREWEDAQHLLGRGASRSPSV